LSQYRHGGTMLLGLPRGMEPLDVATDVVQMTLYDFDTECNGDALFEMLYSQYSEVKLWIYGQGWPHCPLVGSA
jgi:hypothetical protein